MPGLVALHTNKAFKVEDLDHQSCCQLFSLKLLLWPGDWLLMVALKMAGLPCVALGSRQAVFMPSGSTGSRNEWDWRC